MESRQIWPTQVRAILVALIPKSDGGRRPIGLLPTIVRVWERVRKPIVAAWRCTVERPYNWAAKGRCPQDAVWRRALMDEANLEEGKSAGAVLLDLTKAFEMVKLEIVWRVGLRLHFHPVLLAMILESFSFARVLTIQGAVSDPVHTLSLIHISEPTRLV